MAGLPLPIRGARLIPAVLAGLAVACPAGAQKLFKYQDASGVWVYTDRQPAGAQSFEESELARRFVKPEIKLTQRASRTSIAVLAENTYFAPVQLAFRLRPIDNVAADTPSRGIKVLPARSQTELITVAKVSELSEARFEYEFQYIPGEPGVEHEPTQPYRLPYPLSSAVRVSQAYPATTTHGDEGSRHAIDFVMPIGTYVYAAREGVVIEVASDFYESGTDHAVDGPRANIVRVLHDDGTMALYVHLNWNSIRVVPGQRVRRGEHIADSGNTGFSTGPHLHFVVQRNADGQLVSVPVQFAGASGAPITVEAGGTYTAF
jgi:murein DD-endopeptidase MepM/ murein hydrolase activator NlpD